MATISAETLRVIDRLKGISRELNSTACPSRSIIWACESDLFECFASYDGNKDIKETIRSAAKKFKAIVSNYDEFHEKYKIKRAVVNQIRGQISAIVSDIAKNEGIDLREFKHKQQT